MELMGIEIKRAVTFRCREGKNLVLNGENSQCPGGLGSLIEIETLLAGREILLKYSNDSYRGSARHGTCINGHEFVMQHNTRYIAGVKNGRRYRNRAAGVE